MDISKAILVLKLLSILCLGMAATSSAEVTCRDEDGKPVDWYYAYKLPKIFNKQRKVNGNTDVSGVRYMFFTSQSQGWQLSNKRINESDSMFGKTLQTIFDNNTLLLLAYNDEFPNGTTIATRGHTKGVVATDGQTGVWLIHSVPKYPAIPNYNYPRTGERYAQSFLCLSLSSHEMDKVGQQLIYNEAHMYFTRLPPQLSGHFPTLEQAMKELWHKKAPYYNMVDLQTLAGHTFKSFAKGSRYGLELYEDWLAPSLGVDLFVESWRKGSGNLQSNCTRSKSVYNIEEIKSQELQINFKTTNDHSKWAVSEESGVEVYPYHSDDITYWICVGDINRQKHQLQRGGGTVCQNNQQVAKLFQQLISDFEPCEKENNINFYKNWSSV